MPPASHPMAFPAPDAPRAPPHGISSPDAPAPHPMAFPASDAELTHLPAFLGAGWGAPGCSAPGRVNGRARILARWPEAIELRSAGLCRNDKGMSLKRRPPAPPRPGHLLACVFACGRLAGAGRGAGSGQTAVLGIRGACLGEPACSRRPACPTVVNARGAFKAVRGWTCTEQRRRALPSRFCSPEAFLDAQLASLMTQRLLVPGLPLPAGHVGEGLGLKDMPKVTGRFQSHAAGTSGSDLWAAERALLNAAAVAWADPNGSPSGEAQGPVKDAGDKRPGLHGGHCAPTGPGVGRAQGLQRLRLQKQRVTRGLAGSPEPGRLSGRRGRTWPHEQAAPRFGGTSGAPRPAPSCCAVRAGRGAQGGFRSFPRGHPRSLTPTWTQSGRGCRPGLTCCWKGRESVCTGTALSQVTCQEAVHGRGHRPPWRRAVLPPLEVGGCDAGASQVLESETTPPGPPETVFLGTRRGRVGAPGRRSLLWPVSSTGAGPHRRTGPASELLQWTPDLVLGGQRLPERLQQESHGGGLSRRSGPGTPQRESGDKGRGQTGLGVVSAHQEGVLAEERRRREEPEPAQEPREQVWPEEAGAQPREVSLLLAKAFASMRSGWGSEPWPASCHALALLGLASSSVKWAYAWGSSQSPSASGLRNEIQAARAPERGSQPLSAPLWAGEAGGRAAVWNLPPNFSNTLKCVCPSGPRSAGRATALALTTAVLFPAFRTLSGAVFPSPWAQRGPPQGLEGPRAEERPSVSRMRSSALPGDPCDLRAWRAVGVSAQAQALGGDGCFLHTRPAQKFRGGAGGRCPHGAPWSVPAQTLPHTASAGSGRPARRSPVLAADRPVGALKELSCPLEPLDGRWTAAPSTNFPRPLTGLSLSFSVSPFRRSARASLVAQWLRICLPVQGTRVRALVREDPTCHGATKPVRHNY
ncbi:hypothetical protein J1605_009203 [Eschrichtius robustus]|uniref:Uncharacterized protein n=1 Tax=Eschrichtius robustus TaxID=9764 RepID=A0AB34GTS2_ESCRO|nr:hypothetical protein J1605_009203 [Eschrichtius robustus]